MNSMRLSELLQVRISPQMKTFFQNEAQRLGVRTVDIVRMALIKAVTSNPHLETNYNEEKNHEP